jgi:hypothetical protein
MLMPPERNQTQGMRIDIYFIGILILKMLGKMRIDENDDKCTSDQLKIQNLEVFYK